MKNYHQLLCNIIIYSNCDKYMTKDIANIKAISYLFNNINFGIKYVEIIIVIIVFSITVII